MPTKAELARMPGFQRKLNRFVGERRVAALAREIGVEASTLQRWLTGQSPTLTALKALSEGTGIPVAYWADDGVPPRDFARPGGRGASMKAAPVRAGRIAAAKVRGRGERPPGEAEAFVLDADDPRALEVQGACGLLCAGDGDVVVFDAGRPGRAKDGEPVVVEIGGRLTVRRRQTTEGSRVYVGATEDVKPVIVPLGEVGEEYPVVALIRRHRRGGRAAGIEPRPGHAAAEDAAPYGRRGRKK